jgi:hypothetical protein
LFKDWEVSHPEAFRELLAEDYDYVGRVYFADVYRLKGYHPPAVDGQAASAADVLPLPY